MERDNDKEFTAGDITVITGSMFAGKTSELQERLKKAYMARKHPILIKYINDNRYKEGEHNNVTHSGSLYPAIGISKIEEAVVPSNCKVIGIDEGHFHGDGLFDWCQKQANEEGRHIIVCCLSTTWEMKPFPNILSLLAVCEEHVIKKAICAVCGNEAHYTTAIVNISGDLFVGGAEDYVPTCRTHHGKEIPNRPQYFKLVNGLKSLNKSIDISVSPESDSIDSKIE